MGMSGMGVSVTAIAVGPTSAQRLDRGSEPRVARLPRCDLGVHPTRDLHHDEAGVAGAAMASAGRSHFRLSSRSSAVIRSARVSSIGDGYRGRRRERLAGKDGIVGIAEYQDLRRAPNDRLQLHHRAHPQPKLPKQKVLNEIPRDPPAQEREPPIADRTKAEPAQLENKKVGAEKIVAPILEERRNA